MPNIKALSLGGYETNCYIVSGADSQDCVIIDPGYAPETILETLADFSLTPTAILLTHGHFDHVGAVEALIQRTVCRLYIHKADWCLPETAAVKQLYPLANSPSISVNFYSHGDILSEANLKFLVRHTPGHTEGSVCLECENALFTGDTLFAGSCGRTDLPGGDPKAMKSALQYLSSLEENYEIYPGHGGETCLDAEKRYNPYLRGLL